MMSSLNEIRLHNTLWIFEAFRQQVAPGDVAVRGLDKAFAGQLGISPSYWAQIKSTDKPKNIGPNLARQFERKFHMAPGWLDKAHANVSPLPEELRLLASDASELAFLKTARRIYRLTPGVAKTWAQEHDTDLPANARIQKK
jgi:hypothetical protein